MISDYDCDCRECKQDSGSPLIFDNDFCFKFAIALLLYLCLWYMNLLVHFLIFLTMVNFVAFVLNTLALLFGIKEQHNDLINYYMIASLISFLILFALYLIV